jgi:hypothetical protein
MIGHSKIGRKLVFIAIAVPMLVQMSHYEVYRSFASSFGFHELYQLNVVSKYNNTKPIIFKP